MLWTIELFELNGKTDKVELCSIALMSFTV